ncbi:hypothetical protein HZ326_28055 [Fusarium oxysporum f. sp. albedinis]|nr:hypothetical protein HZ326_28055 [Fusarium oxysporum f. sp. albedinis]
MPSSTPGTHPPGDSRGLEQRSIYPTVEVDSLSRMLLKSDIGGSQSCSMRAKGISLKNPSTAFLRRKLRKKYSRPEKSADRLDQPGVLLEPGLLLLIHNPSLVRLIGS